MDKTYISVSAVMFLEFAIWGAWAPVLAARLLGPLKMTGKQTGWIYATLPLACIFAPFVAGQLADSTLNAEYILAGAHLVGAVLLFAAVRMQSFGSLFLTMLFYSICYASTLPLVNAVLFRHASDKAGYVFIWAPVAWALVGYFLTGWRNVRKTEGDGSDCLVLAAVLSLVMAGASLLVPATAPEGAGKAMPIAETLGLLKDFDFLVFIVVSFVVAGMMQFYFLGSAQFMIDSGISGKNVPATMAIAQAAQSIATIVVLWVGILAFLDRPADQQNVLGVLGYKGTLTLGSACWLLMYAAYVAGKPKALIVSSQVLHGLAYVMFIIVGQMYMAKVAPASIQSSAQALIIAATTGVGMFLGTQAAGVVMDTFKADGKFQWRKVWAVPMTVVLLGTLALAGVFQGKGATTETAAPKAEAQTSVPEAAQV